jgi:uncharacterized protein YggE
MIGMQMIEHPWGVTAHGTATVRATPDMARITFRVTRLEQAPPAAFAAASGIVDAARQVLRDHRIPDTAVEGSRLSLASSWNYGGGQRELLGYQCTAAFAVESRELDDVQQLLADLVAAGAGEIEGVHFGVSDASGLRAQARGEAVQAARRKAGLYAEAAGIRLGAILHIDDEDPEPAGTLRFTSAAASAGGAAENLAPGSVVVSAAVILGFAIGHD